MITSKRLMRAHARAYLALGLGWLCSLAACAHQAPHEHVHAAKEVPGTIQVTGVGEAHGAPDVARSSIGVEARAPSVQEALQRANAQIAQIIQALKAQGIADADLQTQGFSVNYDREYQPPMPLGATPQAAAGTASAAASAPAPRTKKAAGAEAAPVSEIAAPAPAPARGSYVVSNQLQVTVREVNKLGDVLSAATAAGANNIWGISFDLSDKQPLIEKARALAIESAKRDAERVAALSGVKLGKLLRITDGELGGAVPVASMRTYRADVAVPVERGELTIDHRVSVEYAIGE